MQGTRGWRRWRIRRKRGQGFVGDLAAEAPAQLGCCLFELVASAAVLAGLLVIPVDLVLR